MGGKYDLWIPASDAGTEGVFLNMNDESALSYTNWNKNEPNDYGSGENFVHMILTDGNSYDVWNDIKSHNHADQPDRIAYGQNNAFICIMILSKRTEVIKFPNEPTVQLPSFKNRL